MKTINKIDALKKLKQAVEDTKFGGLCSRINWIQDETTLDQRNYIRSILPKRRLVQYPSYCWIPFQKATRIKFINAKIAQLKKRLH